MRLGARGHKWAAIGWLIVGLPICIFYGRTVFEFVVLFWSLYAIVVGHWGSYQAARAEEASNGSDTGDRGDLQGD